MVPIVCAGSVMATAAKNRWEAAFRRLRLALVGDSDPAVMEGIIGEFCVMAARFPDGAFWDADAVGLDPAGYGGRAGA